MAEQQLVDYIKKAKDAGQSDEQTRTLLTKNGWTDTEITDAFTALSPAQPQAQPMAQKTQPQPKPQPQVNRPAVDVKAQAEIKPQLQEQPQVQFQAQPKIQPQAQPVQPEPAQSNMPKSRGGSHLVIKLLMVLIIVVVLAGVGYFAAAQFLNLPNLLAWNPFAPSPETVLNTMLKNMQTVKSSETTMIGEVDATANKVPQGKLLFNTKSKGDITNINNPKADVTFSMQLILPGATSPLASANLEAIVVGAVSYFKLDNITIPNGYSYSGFNVSQINGKWFEMDQNSVKALSQVESGQLPINISQSNGAAFTQKLQSLVFSENMFSVKSQLGDAVVSGQDTYHYLVVISKDKLKDLINKIIALQTQQTASTQGGSAAAGSGSLGQSMAESFVGSFVDAIGDINVEMWIGKKDYLLYQAKVDKVVDLSKMLGTGAPTLEMMFNSTSSNFNQPVSISAPVNSQKIENILLPILKNQMASQKMQSDFNHMWTISESIFPAAGSYSTLCYHGLLNGYLATYGKDLISINNDIVSQGAKKVTCFADAQDYCVSTQLADGSFICMNKVGMTGTTKCLSASTVCK